MSVDERAIAEKLMEEIMYDNGWVNRLEPEFFDPAWVSKIGAVAGPFFENHRHLLNDEALEDIVCGEYGENQQKYSSLNGFKELDEVLNAYFESGGNIGRVAAQLRVVLQVRLG